jgi:hypothetical protein
MEAFSRPGLELIHALHAQLEAASSDEPQVLDVCVVCGSTNGPWRRGPLGVRIGTRLCNSCGVSALLRVSPSVTDSLSPPSISKGRKHQPGPTRRHCTCWRTSG